LPITKNDIISVLCDLTNGKKSVERVLNDEMRADLLKCSQLEIQNLTELKGNPASQMQYWQVLKRDIALRSHIEEHTTNTYDRKASLYGFVITTIHYLDPVRRPTRHIFAKADNHNLFTDFKKTENVWTREKSK